MYIEEKRKEKAGGTGGDGGLWTLLWQELCAGALGSWFNCRIQSKRCQGQGGDVLPSQCVRTLAGSQSSPSWVRGMCGRTSPSATDGKQAKWQQEKRHNKGKTEWQAVKAEVSTSTGTINTALG